MVEHNEEARAQGEDGYNAARRYRDYHERTQRFIHGRADNLEAPEHEPRVKADAEASQAGC